jgi:hypothetical protein
VQQSKTASARLWADHITRLAADLVHGRFSAVVAARALWMLASILPRWRMIERSASRRLTSRSVSAATATGSILASRSARAATV